MLPSALTGIAQQSKLEVIFDIIRFTLNGIIKWQI